MTRAWTCTVTLLSLLSLLGGCWRTECLGSATDTYVVEGQYVITASPAGASIVDAHVSFVGTDVVVEYEREDGSRWRATYEVAGPIR